MHRFRDAPDLYGTKPQAVSGAIVIIAHRNGTGTLLIEANY
jgi:hypothetical protein